MTRYPRHDGSAARQPEVPIPTERRPLADPAWVAVIGGLASGLPTGLLLASLVFVVGVGRLLPEEWWPLDCAVSDAIPEFGQAVPGAAMAALAFAALGAALHARARRAGGRPSGAILASHAVAACNLFAIALVVSPITQRVNIACPWISTCQATWPLE